MGTFKKDDHFNKRLSSRLRLNRRVKYLFFFATTIGVLVLAMLLTDIIGKSIGWLDIDFLTNYASRNPEDAGVYAAIVGSLYLLAVTVPVSLTIGIGTAIYLEEYAPKNRFTRFVQTNISNLASVPSIVFGLMGLTVFVRALGLGRSVLAAGLTMSLLALPVIVITTQEAIRAVPAHLREASYGMGATKWQTIRKVVIPVATPGILTGTILAISRIIGETAPLIVLGIPVFVAFLPTSVMDTFTTLPMQIYNWTSRPQEEFQHVAAAGIVVLLVILLMLNAVAILVRNKMQKKY